MKHLLIFVILLVFDNVKSSETMNIEIYEKNGRFIYKLLSKCFVLELIFSVIR